jgi:hypothetical protein
MARKLSLKVGVRRVVAENGGGRIENATIILAERLAKAPGKATGGFFQAGRLVT